MCWIRLASSFGETQKWAVTMQSCTSLARASAFNCHTVQCFNNHSYPDSASQSLITCIIHLVKPIQTSNGIETTDPSQSQTASKQLTLLSNEEAWSQSILSWALLTRVNHQQMMFLICLVSMKITFSYMKSLAKLKLFPKAKLRKTVRGHKNSELAYWLTLRRKKNCA